MLPLLVPAASLALVLGAPTGADSRSSPAPARTFRFTYAATVTGLKPGQAVRIWLPVPPANEDQDVQVISQQLPGPGRRGRDATYGNSILYVEASANERGEIPLQRVYRVSRREVGSEAVGEDAKQIERLLQPDARVPVGGKPLKLLEGKQLPTDDLAAARVLYDVVNGYMRYSKEGTGWGQGDAAWACDSGYGNCSDFHSLFISLARSRKIPAKFEIGFLLPPRHGKGELAGYHCWAKFRASGKGWVPVDISEASKDPSRRDYYFGRLTPDRVTFSTGRDIELVPRQAGPLLNFFVYPYVEVDGKALPDAQIRRRFEFRDD